MNNHNGLIRRAVDAEIKRLILRGELILPCTVEEDLEANLRCKRKMLVIAYHRGLGIGKERYRKKVLPQLDWVEDLYFSEKEKSDQEYAMSVIDRMYAEIMGEDEE